MAVSFFNSASIAGNQLASKTPLEKTFSTKLTPFKINTNGEQFNTKIVSFYVFKFIEILFSDLDAKKHVI